MKKVFKCLRKLQQKFVKIVLKRLTGREHPKILIYKFEERFHTRKHTFCA